MTATATVTADYTVLLTTDAPLPGGWYRVTGEPDRLVGDTQTAEDRWAPLNVPIGYYWRSAGGVEETATVTVTAAKPVLSSALGAGTALVTVISQPPLRWEGRSVAHAILGRVDPLVTVIRPTYHAADLVLDAPDMVQRQTLRQLLITGYPLILRSTCPAAVDDVTLLPLSWSEEPRGDRPAGARNFTISYQAVMDKPSEYTPIPPWTWADLAAAEAAWTDVTSDYGTWVDVSEGPL